MPKSTKPEMKDDETGIFNIPIRIDELMMALVNSGRATGLFLQDTFPIPPLTSVEYTFNIPTTGGQKNVAIFISFQASPDPDGQIAMAFFADGEIKFADPAMIASMYERGINFLRDYALIWYATNSFGVKFFNTSTTDTATISFRATWAYMPKNDFDKINDKYFTVIKNWLLD